MGAFLLNVPNMIVKYTNMIMRLYNLHDYEIIQLTIIIHEYEIIQVTRL